jgi:hypothetical protein
VPKLFAETSVSEQVKEPTPEITTTELPSILLETEDVPLETEASLNAESMVDQTKMTEALKLMSNAQVNHGYHHTLELVKNSESPEKVGLKEEAEMYGDHSLHTTSGITTTVLKLSAEICNLELVLEPRLETHITELLSILLETEDVLLLTETFLNAESTVDQTTMIQVLKLMSDAQDHHIRDLHSIRSVQNSLSAETQIPVMYGENLMMVHGDHLLLTTSGITTMVLLLYAET